MFWRPFRESHVILQLNKTSSVSPVPVLSMENVLDLIILGMGKEEGPDQSAETTSTVVRN